MIRVKLTRLGAPEKIVMSVDCDYYLSSDPSVRIASGDEVTIEASGSTLVMNAGKNRFRLGETAKLMRAQSGNRGLLFKQPELSGRFCGDLGLSASGGVLTAILNIYIENYLYGVVGYAMPPSSGLEALKAQAMVSRTYALRRKAGRGDALYDLTDAASDQGFKGYNGTSDYANVVQAVDDTRGGVLYYGNALAQCYWCVSNGGQTESAQNAFGTALDYAVVQDDSFDFDASAATVKTATVNKDLSNLKPELLDALTQRVNAALVTDGMDAEAVDVKLKALESVTACDSRFPAPSRLYKSLTFKLAVEGNGADGVRRSGTATISVPTYGGFEDWYDLSINPEDNETVWVRETDSAFEIAFRRAGSGVGLSQRGAQVMAQQGKRAQDILAFYYPGVEARQVDLTDATRDARAAEPDAIRPAIATARLSDRTDLLSAPEDGGMVTATVAAGVAVEVYGVQGEWAAVGSSGKYGYVRVDALESFSLVGVTVVRAEETTLGAMREAADILRLPVAGARVVGRAEAGSEVQVYAWTDAWVMLRTAGGIKGFAPFDAVRFEVPAQPKSAPEATPEATLTPEETLAPPPDVFTDAEGTPEALTKADATLFENPSELSNALDVLPEGAVVRVLAFSRDWARVRTGDGVEGYLRQDSIKAREHADIEGGEIHKVKGKKKKYLYVTADLAAMRASYSDDSDALATLCCGEKVRVGAYNEAWACVKVEGVKDYGFVRMASLSELRPDAPEGGAFTRMKVETTALVTADKSPITAGLSADAKTVAKLNKGRRVRVIASNASFALVKTEDGEGYMRLESLSLESLTGTVTRESGDAVVKRDMKVYGAAGEKGGVLGRVHRGDQVRVTAWNDTYAAIDFEGGTGYVRLKHLERTSDVPVQ